MNYILELGNGSNYPRSAYIGEYESCLKYAEEWASLFPDAKRLSDIGTQQGWRDGRSQFLIAMINPVSHYNDEWYAQHQYYELLRREVMHG